MLGDQGQRTREVPACVRRLSTLEQTKLGRVGLLA
jgi:hypothetical protein